MVLAGSATFLYPFVEIVRIDKQRSSSGLGSRSGSGLGSGLGGQEDLLTLKPAERQP